MHLSLCSLAAFRALLLIIAILIGSLTMAARVEAAAGRESTAATGMAGDHCAMQAGGQGEGQPSSDHRDMPARHCALSCALVLPFAPQPSLRAGQFVAPPGAAEPAPLDGVLVRLHLPPPRA